MCNALFFCNFECEVCAVIICILLVIVLLGCL